MLLTAVCYMHNKWTFEREWRPESAYIELTMLPRAVGRSKNPGGGRERQISSNQRPVEGEYFALINGLLREIGGLHRRAYHIIKGRRNV